MSIWDLELSSKKLEEREDNNKLRIGKLNKESRKEYHNRFLKQFKDVDTYVTLCYIIGIGIHHLYLKKYKFFILDFLTSSFWILSLIYILFIQDLPINIYYEIYGKTVFISFVCLFYNVLDFLICLIFSQQIVGNNNQNNAEKILQELNQ